MKSFTIIRRRKNKNKEEAEDAANKRRRRPAIGQEIIILCSGKGEEKRRVSFMKMTFCKKLSFAILSLNIS